MNKDHINERQDLRQRSLQRRWLRRRLILWGLICLAFFVWAGIELIELTGDISDKRRDFEETKQRLAQTEKEMKELQTKVENLQDPDYIAEIARKEYYMTKPGEVIFIENRD